MWLPMPDTISDSSLQSADRIVLVDPNRPGWCRPLFVRFLLRNEKTVEIPVDSTDQLTIKKWADRIRALHLDD
jgi:hypothetical protein